MCYGFDEKLYKRLCSFFDCILIYSDTLLLNRYWLYVTKKA